MKEILCFLLWILSLSNMMAQNNILRGQEPSTECIRKHEKKLTKKFKKTDCFDLADGLNYLFIYTLGFNQRPSPDVLLDKGLMRKLDFLYRKKSDFPINDAAIFNQNKKVVGVSEGLNVYCYYESLLAGDAYKVEKKLVEYKFDQNPEKIFRINATPSGLYFAEKGEEVEALLFKNDQLKILNLNDFVECCWEEYFPEELLDLHYQH